MHHTKKSFEAWCEHITECARNMTEGRNGCPINWKNVNFAWAERYQGDEPLATSIDALVVAGWDSVVKAFEPHGLGPKKRERRPQKAANLLKELRDLLSLDSARFAGKVRIETKDIFGRGAFSEDREAEVFEGEFTDAVRHATRLWRDTWIFPIIDKLEAILEHR